MKTDKGFFTFRKISLSLHKKILLSYLCLLILTCGLVSIIFVERAKVRESERILKSINTVRRSIDDVHFAIIRLCTKGESVISWDNSDFNIYNTSVNFYRSIVIYFCIFIFVNILFKGDKFMGISFIQVSLGSTSR